jgi:PTH1 family peptidyl-tRNA hydrolase
VSEQKLKLIVGLGNPGAEYAETRHNLGFILLDAVANNNQAAWKEKTKFKALTTEILVDGQKIILAKPTTFYNLSGEAVQSIMGFYKLDAEDLLVIHDELDLPFGTIRARTQGSDAGNNGIKNVIACIGDNFARIRVGIANELLAHYSKEDFVLGRMGKEELAKMPLITEHVSQFLTDFIQEDKIFEHASIRL